ncbi:hypothetical protein NEUTE1DRAFT_112750 [Neurospora tetrasperma FGSC 2508]|uniref:Uncharacterized protein n=1 Tax=Neurospora tetrasperma (strain FGSC 2508 / ATCC MYA-4615 / P0657) TaxID=510951 RepID=F8MWU5_NEUT8|nr:uncharacterized protein NEUTE1DRAFT_112750 [Neurospora tetrasperma FGSC 2508]EGO54216.1 hypothetical protein NEUTE1DRAFT_112750 [Neurospora tetrasperma FGSC 2508]EGZ68352.1 hypothetical protein NEUTE2DRAFT_141977 [Neurospora tetrasperma FGSC 2509]
MALTKKLLSARVHRTRFNIVHASQVNRKSVIDPISSRHQETPPRSKVRPIRLLALHHGAILALPSRKTKKNDEESKPEKKRKKSNVPRAAMQRASPDAGHVGHVSGYHGL